MEEPEFKSRESDSRARLNSTRYSLPLHEKHCEQVWVFASTHWYYNLLAPSVCWTNHITIQRPLLGTAGKYSLATPAGPRELASLYRAGGGLLLSELWTHCYLSLSVSMSVFLPRPWAPWDHTHTHTHAFSFQTQVVYLGGDPRQQLGRGRETAKGKESTQSVLWGQSPVRALDDMFLTLSLDMSHWMTCSDSHSSNTYSDTASQALRKGRHITEGEVLTLDGGHRQI